MTVSVAFVQAGGYAATLDRRSRAALLTKGSAATSARTGILPFAGAELLPVAAGTPNMTTITSAGAVVIADSAGGAYVFTSDASTTLTHAAANGTNPRIDLVIARVYDNEAGDAASTTSLTLPGSAGTATVQTITGAIEIVQGTPAATPAVPALPSTRCVILRQATVRAAATSILNSDLANTGRPGWTVASGGVLPVGTTAELAALSQYEGMYADDNQANQLVRSDGTAFATAADPAVFTAWTNYTPVWTGEGGGTANLGTGGSLSGRWKQIGKTVHGELTMLIGTSATGPSGVWNWTLPVAAAMQLGTNVDIRIGGCDYFGGGVLIGSVYARYSSAGARLILWFNTFSAPAQAANPAGWGATVRMTANFRYEAA